MPVHLLKNYGVLATQTLCGLDVAALFAGEHDINEIHWSHFGAETCEGCRAKATKRIDGAFAPGNGATR